VELYIWAGLSIRCGYKLGESCYNGTISWLYVELYIWAGLSIRCGYKLGELFRCGYKLGESCYNQILRLEHRKYSTQKSASVHNELCNLCCEKNIH